MTEREQHRKERNSLLRSVKTALRRGAILSVFPGAFFGILGAIRKWHAVGFEKGLLIFGAIALFFGLLGGGARVQVPVPNPGMMDSTTIKRLVRPSRPDDPGISAAMLVSGVILLAASLAIDLLR
ncbi:MAG: hypothetical protein ACYDCC_09450 [Actinomycetota bacterium]